MDLILNGLNGRYLRNITESAALDTTRVQAAVAYATTNDVLFEWCSKHNISLSFYGRLDDQVAVNTRVLKWFLDRKSLALSCKLVQHHHSKVIWWHGYGLYIGSANLTNSAWNNNIEAGCFF